MINIFHSCTRGLYAHTCMPIATTHHHTDLQTKRKMTMTSNKGINSTNVLNASVLVQRNTE